MSMFSKFVFFYWRFFKTPEQYARHIGVSIGKNCKIETRGFSSEPYLISVGDNVALTSDVKIHTHGGGESLGVYTRNLMYLVKWSLKIGLILELDPKLCQVSLSVKVH